MGIFGWFKELGSDLVSADANLERDLYNVGGDWHNLRIDQKINLAKQLGYDLEFDEDDNEYVSESGGSDGVVDGILRMFLGEGND